EPGKGNAHMLGLPQRLKREADQVVCGSCGAKNSAKNNFCPECGAKL
ncbi:MAG: zinc-ribbon domain-containing protein, partial [Cyanobacteria bacterium P01_A01_bin.135]